MNTAQRDAGRVKGVEAVAVLRGEPAAVFAHLVSSQGAWRVGVVQWQPLSRAPLAVGARIEETRIVLGKPRTSVFTVERLDPPRALELLREDGARLAFELEPREGGTRVSCRLVPPRGGLAAWLPVPLRRRAAQASLDAQLGALRDLVERRRS